MDTAHSKAVLKRRKKVKHLFRVGYDQQMISADLKVHRSTIARDFVALGLAMFSKISDTPTLHRTNTPSHQRTNALSSFFSAIDR